MKFYDKNEAIDIMNFFGTKKTPFIFVVDFEMKRIFVQELSKINSNYLKFNFNGITNDDFSAVIKKYNIEILPIDFASYSEKFEIIQKNILAGNTYLLNLTERVRIKTDLSLLDIFRISKAKYKLWFYDEFVFFSPEIFVKIIDGKIFSHPMKGTIDATLPNAIDIIKNDEKELAEHYTIVDLIRNDLSIVAKNVRVKRFRYIDKIMNEKGGIFQVSSEIYGELPENFNERIGEILFSLLPAGSVSGAPKPKTVEIIKQAEQSERGFYTGVSGIFDGENLDSCVNIRFIEKDNDQMFYRSGGGITFMSDLQKEYDEILKKIYIPK